MIEQTAIPTECLQLIARKNKTGCLIVTDPQNNLLQWEIYFHQGQINYATSLIGQQERLTYLVQQFQTSLKFPLGHSGNTEYQEIYNYWLIHKLPIIDLQKLYLKLTQETLVQVSAIERSSVRYLANYQLQPTVINYSWRDFCKQFQSTVHQWRQLKTEISSPFNRLCLDTQKVFEFYKAWQTWSKEQEFFQVFGTQTLSQWLHNLSQKLCLYEIATQMRVCPLKLALKLQPLIESGAIQILPFQEAISQTTNVMRESQAVITQAVSSLQTPPSTQTLLTEANPRDSYEDLKNTLTGISEPMDTRTSSFESISKQNHRTTSPGDSRPLIVCIDDSKAVQQQVTRTLEAVGYQIITITEPASALSVLIRHRPVLILLDINMPEIDGYELYQMLNRSRKLRDIPVVMLTGREGIVDRFRAKFIGVSEYLTKPCNPNELIEVVQKLVHSSYSVP